MVSPVDLRIAGRTRVLVIACWTAVIVQAAQFVCIELSYDLYGGGSFLRLFEAQSFNLQERHSDLSNLFRLTSGESIVVNPSNYPMFAHFVNFIFSRVASASVLLTLGTLGILYCSIRFLIRFAYSASLPLPRTFAIISSITYFPIWYLWDRGSSDIIVIGLSLLAVHALSYSPVLGGIILGVSGAYKYYGGLLFLFYAGQSGRFVVDINCGIGQAARQKLARFFGIGVVVFVALTALFLVPEIGSTFLTAEIKEGGDDVWSRISSIVDVENHHEFSFRSISLGGLLPPRLDGAADLLMVTLSVLLWLWVLTSVFVLFSILWRGIFDPSLYFVSAALLAVCSPISPVYRLVGLWLIFVAFLPRSELVEKKAGVKSLTLLIIGSVDWFSAFDLFGLEDAVFLQTFISITCICAVISTILISIRRVATDYERLTDSRQDRFTRCR